MMARSGRQRMGSVLVREGRTQDSKESDYRHAKIEDMASMISKLFGRAQKVIRSFLEELKSLSVMKQAAQQEIQTLHDAI
ncbi:unnamed protein product [Urochloa humidicola]